LSGIKLIHLGNLKYAMLLTIAHKLRLQFKNVAPHLQDIKIKNIILS